MNSISIAMCTFNGERFLDEQLNSLRNQSLLPAELVICDDGSSDRTEEIVKLFARSAPFAVRWVRNETQLGYRRNFIKAAGLCSSDLTAFCDQDDIWHADKLYRTSLPFDDAEVMMTYHSAGLIDAEGNYIGEYNDRAPLINPIQPPYFDPWLFGLGFTLTFRKTLGVANYLWPISKDYYGAEKPLAHDQWYFFIATALGRVVYIDEPLADYRQHDRNLFGSMGGARSRPETYKGRVKWKYNRFVNYQAACDSNVKVLAELEDKLQPDQARKTKEVLRVYSKFGRIFKLSARIYERRSVLRRLHAVYQLIVLGCYDNMTSWSFEPRSAVKDIVACLLPTQLD